LDINGLVVATRDKIQLMAAMAAMAHRCGTMLATFFKVRRRTHFYILLLEGSSM